MSKRFVLNLVAEIARLQCKVDSLHAMAKRAEADGLSVPAKCILVVTESDEVYARDKILSPQPERPDAG